MIAPDLKPLARPIDDFHLLEGNPRRGDVQAVARSYERFGQRKPIVARRDGTVIAGNHQLLAARSLGWTEIAVVYVDDDDLTASAYALADNRTADLGSYDTEALAELIAEVSVDLDLLLATGYTPDDLDELIASLDPEEVPYIGDPETIPESVTAKTVPGDIWILGPHRLLCGDSTVLENYQKVLTGKSADMIWTDPPYGVAIQELDLEQAKARNRRTDGKGVMNDDLVGKDLHAFLTDSLSNAYISSRDGAVWYVAGPPGNLAVIFGGVLEEIGILRHILIWEKDQFVMGRADYHYQHENIFYGWKEGAAHLWNSDRKQTSILRFDRPRRSPEHPTMKPLDLIEYCIGNSSHRGDTILDPFGGSGSTLMAAHSTGRIARLIELDPRYCDVICARFQAATGIQPIAESIGQPHDFLIEK